MPLRLTGSVHVAPDADRLYDDLAHALMGAAINAVKDRGEFHLALSGGKSPEPFFIRVVTDPRYRLIPWKYAHIWMVDERRVPPTDERSNWKMIHETLTDHLGIRTKQMHPMPALAEDAATAYERELRQVIGGGAGAAAGPAVPAGALVKAEPAPRLDFVMLGMGDDGHTASLFPHSAALQEKQRLVALNDGPTVVPPPRVTMTYPLLNAARELAVLVTGAKKNATLLRIAEQLERSGPDAENLPITGVAPVDGELTWYLDAAAAE